MPSTKRENLMILMDLTANQNKLPAFGTENSKRLEKLLPKYIMSAILELQQKYVNESLDTLIEYIVKITLNDLIQHK